MVLVVGFTAVLRWKAELKFYNLPLKSYFIRNINYMVVNKLKTEINVYNSHRVVLEISIVWM